jgi:hypothetical protein
MHGGWRWAAVLGMAVLLGAYSEQRFAEYQKGDLDAVRLESNGAVVLEEHLWRSAGVSGGGQRLGIRNTNDFHYDEDRSVLTCQRVMRGRDRGMSTSAPTTG